ncbi:caldesmon, smooth muscle-like isoform X2 [Conger conger]|uniref:caldesmon, smooth muscle-like isoform X2 n=1 Tax=Conger conger TaxID=82655 RepID=UPI002A59F121|nr:caldesmon, smooth muscle-like isoform X2 [Conger conger]XP_061085420.1 caldesmon, smooth muscle-like isoform X2 [Conger conger]
MSDMETEEAVAVATENNSMAGTDRSSSLPSAPGEESLQEEPGSGAPRGQQEVPEGRGGGNPELEEELDDPAPLEEQVEDEEEEVSSEEEEEEEAREANKENVTTPQPKEHSGGFHDNTAGNHRNAESSGNARSPEAEEAGGASRQEDREAQDRREKRREAEEELQDLKKRREERRKVQEEAEKQRKWEMEEKKAREEEEKRRMKEGIDRRRAEAAEKRQKMEGEAGKRFTCVTPRGSALKIGDRAEFLNKSAQKSSTVKMGHTPIISKIDDRLEQYTTALQSQRDSRPLRPALDLPVVTEGIRSLKTRWEEGDTYGSVNINKESAQVNIGVAGLISDWLSKTPEGPKSPGVAPADLKPGDVTNKRSLWENRSSPANTPPGDASKPVANGKTPV